MITPAEIRIGNLLQRSKHKNWQERYWGEEVEVGYNEMYLISLENPNEWYEPIVLTEKYLLDFGFSYIPNIQLYSDKKHLIYQMKDNEWCFQPFSTSDTDCHITIKHFHQLQNLIFALTGEELVYTQEGGI